MRMALSGLKIIAVILLAARLLWMYFVPAWNETSTDFPNYYTAARAVWQGRPMADLYDPMWFEREKQRAGIEGPPALFNYYTPFSALVMLPIAGFEALDAKRIWTIVNVLALVGVVLLLRRHAAGPGEGKQDLLLVGLLALLGGDALGNNFLFGQFYIVLTLFLLTAAIFAERRPALAGACLALATIIKIFPAIFIVYFACKRQWKAVWWSIAAGIALTLIGIAALGWVPHRIFIDEVLPRAMRGEIQDPYNIRWNTLQALLRRALVPEPGLNSSPILSAPAIYFFLRPFITIAVVLSTLIAAPRLKNNLLEFGAIIAAVSLATPSQASYHQVLFFPAIVAAVYAVKDVRVRFAIAGAYALICSNYMGAFARFDSGWPMLLAFPRVYVVAVFWLLAVRFVPRRGIAVALGAAILIAAAMTPFELARWRQDEVDGASMARPEDRSTAEMDPAAGAGGLVFVTPQPNGYPLLHPSAFGDGFIYERGGVVYGRLPDGSEIRWAGATEPSLGRESVVAIRDEGNSWSLVEHGRNDADWRELARTDAPIHDPAISGDGQAVAFSHWSNGRYRIAVWDRRTGAVRSVLESSQSDFRYPAWSPDGRWLAFSTNESGDWDVGRFSLIDDHRELLTASLGNDLMPAYAPDGQLYFASDRRRGYRFTAIYRMR